MIKEQWKAACNAHFWQVVEPWEDQTIEQANSNSPTVAYAWGGTEEVAAARARLIASAPDLLEALLDLQRQYKYVTEFMDWGKARAAIAKATGEQK